MTENEQKHPINRKNLWATYLTSILLLLGTAFFWILMDIFTPFFAPLIIVALWGIFVVVAIWSIVLIIKNKQYKNTKAFKPILIQIFAVFIIFSVPFTKIMIDLDFKFKLKGREKVVAMVQSGALTPNVSHNEKLISFPKQYRYLSKGGGEILVENSEKATLVFFFTFRGILENYSGFMYRSDDSYPNNGDFNSEFYEKERLAQNWYWVTAH